ncbi:hypothetical protein ACH5RR_024302 [Cinchona calisaya]|uniref:COP1-interacting protein 7 n=1 Tax=Cinchona calisaya TaxID=153742 RepID=A0ABD2YZU1_9GENT
MRSDMPLDYAVFQLSPKRSRCELVVSSGGNIEKLASGLVKPFVAHLRVAKEQFAMSVHSIKLEVERRKKAEMWFTKGTLERFVRFVSTPEILELANTFDAEMSQLESARRIYSQGTGDKLSGAGGAGSDVTATADATKKELLRAIDVRHLAVQQDLTMACTRAAAAGFNKDTVSDLQMFADCFGAQRLNEACSKFISLCERRPDLILTWKAGGDDRAIRSSYGSDMSIDDEESTSPGSLPVGSHHPTRLEQLSIGQEQGEAEGSSRQNYQHPPFKSSFPLRRSRESSVEPEETSKQNAEKEKKQESASDPPPPPSDQAQSIASSQPSRRLSVQDRINLFENKQKENSGGKQPVVGKSIEIKRLSSDMSSSASAAAVEKAVLRRWSGASDMSLDLSCEKRDIESTLCTPSSSSVSYSKSEDRKDTASSGKPEFRSLPARVDDRTGSGREEVVGARQLTVSSDKSEAASEVEKSNSSLGIFDGDVLKDLTRGKTQPRSNLNRAEYNALNDQANSEPKFRSLPSGKAEEGGLDSQLKSRGPEKREEVVRTKGRVVSEAQVTGQKDKGASQPIFGHFSGKGSDARLAGNLDQPDLVEFSNPKEEVGIKDQSFSQTHLKAPKSAVGDFLPLEGVSGSRILETFAAQNKGKEGNNSSSQRRFESSVETEEIVVKELASGENISPSTALKFEDSGPQRMRFQKQVTASEQMKKTQGRREDSVPVYVSDKTLFSGKVMTQNQEGFSSFSTPPPEHVQRVRQSKGNQELNDELKMKANELEKLFAEHKLRAPGDQSNPTRRSRPVDRESEPPAKSLRKPSADFATTHMPDDTSLPEPAESSTNAKFNDVPAKMISDHNYSDVVNKNFSELKVSDGSRGKFYERYMQKRNEKLKEDWSSNRAEKEAKLKAMQDSLEWSKAEMKAKFSVSADRQASLFSARRRAERLRSFNTRSIMRREQQQLDFGPSDDDDEDASDNPEQKYYGEDGSFNEKSLTDGLSKSKQIKKNSLTKSSSSTTPRMSAAPVPRASNISGRRKMQSENPLAQSVPNFSDLRKENSKPSATTSKTTRPQLRNYTRSKSNSEDSSFVKEERSRRSQSLRKSLANPVEFREISPLNSDGNSLATQKFDKDETEQSPYGKYSKTSESKPFLKKGSGMDFGARATVALQKTIMASDTANDEGEFDDSAFEVDDSVDLVKNEEEEFKTVASKHHGEQEMDLESLKVNFGSENGAVRSFVQVDSSLVAELPAAVPSGFHPTENLQDSPGESPVSWNSRTHHPFSYSHEMSDVDASVDSPVGSPASWNSHSLSQTETDAARMRKKWGAAQKPMLGTSSHNQSRKDMTRGFKRLLKFGRKSRGAESLVDWISATTSEGDDDTEDGRDPANRSSEDLRKSRMGSIQGHPSDDSFNESEFFNEQVQSLRSSIPAPPANFKLREDHLSGSSIKAPRSFFSLSSFRSKGSESKPR